MVLGQFSDATARFAPDRAPSESRTSIRYWQRGDSASSDLLDQQAPAEGDSLELLVSPFTVSFSEDLQTAGVNDVLTWDLREAGADDTFDTVDDGLYGLTAAGGSRSVNLSLTDGPPQPGAYRFTAFATGLLDRFGNPLDGNADGTGGDNLVRHFTVALAADVQLESRSNNGAAAATPLPLFEDPSGSGYFTSRVGLRTVDPGNDNDYWSFAAEQGDQLIVRGESGVVNRPH